MGNSATSSMISVYHTWEATPALVVPVVFLVCGFIVQSCYRLLLCIYHACRKLNCCKPICCSCCRCQYCQCQVGEDEVGFCEDFCHWFFWTWQSYVTILFSHTVVKRVKNANDEGAPHHQTSKGGYFLYDNPQKVVLLAGIEPDNVKHCGCTPSGWAIT